MFNKKTVVIVGAGASKDFGLPTGAEVYSKLLKEEVEFSEREYHPQRDIFSGSFIQFLEFSNEFTLQQQLPKFIQAVKSDGAANSIDLFADFYPEFTEISKLYSTWSILGSMYVKKKPKHISRGYSPGFDQSYLSPSNIWLNSAIPTILGQPEKENWISALLRKHLEDINQDSENNNLSIITFNYDTILENFLTKSIQKIPKFKDSAKQLIPRVLHVYGAFNTLDDRPHAKDIFSHAENISYIHDNIESSNQALLEIKNEILRAESIFIVGFDAARQNYERINLDKSHAHKFALNYDGNIGLNNRLQSIGVTPDRIMKGSLSKACSQSFFDQADPLTKPPKVAISLHAAKELEAYSNII